ncbi:sialin-like [Saccoglossus kowalevskii]|uniref:Sialin-like n=1 Tax=Saccoglossus kowalevskii TaxID=10224 RepID=A0ABM0GPU3_SACKO|nr:PREDICTED: sialin-like [Saccoglossus kowalevskii]
MTIITSKGDGEYPQKVPFWTSARLSLAVLAFFGFLFLYALRINLSVGMVCMVNNTAVKEISQNEVYQYSNATSSGNVTNLEIDNIDECQVMQHSNSSRDKNEGHFLWEKKTQGLLLSSFFYGYILTQIPGGWLAERYGGKWVFGFSMFLTAVCTLLTPVCANFHWGLLFVLRFVEGLGEGTIFPAMHAMWAVWLPPLERSKLAALAWAGTQIGNVITLPASGLLCVYGFSGGWPSIFYIFGTATLVWFLFWAFLVADSPAKHKRISNVERMYIERTLAEEKSAHKEEKQHHVPWFTIFKSMPFWAILVTHVCCNWGTYSLLTFLPTYMREVLKFDIKQNGLYSALPYIGFWLFINIGGHIADFLRSRKILSTGNTRKLMNTMGSVIPGIFLVITGYMDCTQATTAVILLTIGVSFSGFQYGGGFLVNHVDIAPKYAGVLLGITNTTATISGILAPYVIGTITVNQTQEEWQIVFYIAACIYTFGAVFFIIFGKGEVQDWAKEEPDQEDPDLARKLMSINGSDKTEQKEFETHI